MIEDFIANFRETSPDNVKTFTQGYCYYFATMLKTAFPGGEICWNGHAHFIYLLNGVPYDILGIYESESAIFIPEMYLGNHLADFLHLPQHTSGTTKDEIRNIILQFASDTSFPLSKFDDLLQTYS